MIVNQTRVRAQNARQLTSDQQADLAQLEVVEQTQTKVATLSFPVRRRTHDHSAVVAEIVLRRKPALLLCAGWSIAKGSLPYLKEATKGTKIVILVEACEDGEKPIYHRIAAGQLVSMGRQYVIRRAETKPSDYKALLAALPQRQFDWDSRKAILLICGEITIVSGKNRVDFHRDVPPELTHAVLQASVILNPTHTRMKNDGIVKGWRKFLSGDGRTYVSSSNWDQREKSPKQKISPTLHSFWKDGECRECVKEVATPSFCYREWDSSR